MKAVRVDEITHNVRRAHFWKILADPMRVTFVTTVCFMTRENWGTYPPTHPLRSQETNVHRNFAICNSSWAYAEARSELLASATLTGSFLQYPHQRHEACWVTVSGFRKSTPHSTLKKETRACPCLMLWNPMAISIWSSASNWITLISLSRSGGVGRQG